MARLDADFVTGPDFRVIQMNPARLGLRDQFGTGITSADLRHRRRPAAHSDV
jgi:hypothetical protein